MGLTLTQVSSNVTGHRRQNVVDFVFDSSYPTGGEALTPEALGLSVVEYALVVESPDGYEFLYDRANEKLVAYVPGGDHKVKYVDGQNEGSDNTYDVTGVAVGDVLVEVVEYATKASIATQTDRTSLFSITAADVVSGDGATNRTSNQLRIAWRAAKREVASTANLSAVNGRLVAVGY